VKKNPRYRPAPKKEEAQPVQPAPADHSRKQLWLLIGFSLLLYANTLTLSYTLDDALMITENTFTKQGISGIPEIMSNDAFVGFFGVQKKLVAGGRYRPLSQIMFAAEYELFGLNPFTGHLLNLLLYAACAGLLFLILKKILVKYHHATWYRSLPFVATLLFICHPIHTEVIANIKGRDEILSLLGSLATLHLALIWLNKRKILYLAGIALAFFLALLAKENAITFIAIIPVTLYYFRKSKLKDYLAVTLPLVAGSIAYLLLRFHALGYLTSMEKISEILNDPYVNSTFSEKMATNILTWGIYLKLLIFPHPLTHDYYPWHIQLTGWDNPLVILSTLAYLGMFIYAIAGFRKRTLPSYAILFYLLSFSISSNLVFNIGTFMNERFMFVPLLGFTLLAAWLITVKFRGSEKARTWSPAMLLVIFLCLAYSVKTFSRNLVWKDDFTLFTTDVKTSVNSAKCNVSAGGMYLNRAVTATDSLTKERYLSQSESYLRHAISIYPGNSSAWVLLGNVFLERKDYAKATEYYIQCLNISNQQKEALSKLRYTGIVGGQAGQYDAGILAFRVLTKLQPENTDHFVQLADLLSKHGQAEEAVRLMDSIILVQPDFADAYSKQGEIYGRVFNDIDRSLALLLKAYSMDSSNNSTLENLGICYGLKGDFPKSLIFFRKALEKDSLNPRLLSNLGNTYGMMGDKTNADLYFRKAKTAK